MNLIVELDCMEDEVGNPVLIDINVPDLSHLKV